MHVQSGCFDCHSLDVAVKPDAYEEDKVERQARD